MSEALSPARTKSKRERTRDGLVAAAEELLAAHGPDAVSIDEITAAAEVAKGTFYTHFSDKDDIERAIAVLVRGELEAEVGRVNDGIADAAVRMANGLSTYLSFAVWHPVRARTLLRLSSGSVDPEAPANAGLRGDVMLGAKSKRFDVVSIHAAVIGVIGACVAGGSYLVRAPKARAERIASEIVATTLRGLGVKGSDAQKLAEAAVAAAFAKGGKR
jgi:AcrR family transcriptional regulator